jgi:hypothetical protein
MKKNYLMEIIREEISSYLGENEPMFPSPQDQQGEMNSMLNQVENLKKLRDDLDAQIAQLEAYANTFNVNEAGLFGLKDPKNASKGFAATLDPDDATEKSTEFQSKYKKLSEEEETLNEAPFIDGPQGVELFSAIKTASERLKNQFPEATPKDIAKIIKNKKTQTQYAPEVKDELAAQFKKYGGGTFTQELGPDQTLRAVAKALGEYEPGPRGPKAGEPKAAAEPKAKSSSKEKPAAAPKAEKPAAAKAAPAAKSAPAKAEPKAKMEPEDKADAAAMKAASKSKGGTTRAEKYGMLRNELERVTAELKSLAGSPDMDTRKKLTADKMRIEMAMDKLKQIAI